MSWNLLPQWLLPEQWRSDGQKSGLDEEGRRDGTLEHANSNGSMPTTTKQEHSSPESTPKAKPAKAEPVPTFSLSGHDSDGEKPKAARPDEGRPMFAAANNAQIASAMPPPPKPASKPTKSTGPGLMPPPPRPAVKQMGPPPSAASSLRVPLTGPLPNRGPPANSQQRASSGLSPNGEKPTPNARGKVLLSPGHSPMDWAALTRTGNMAGVNTFQRVTPSQLRSMTGRKGKPAWSSWQGKVYNITPYLPFHPGGEAELMKAAGRDGTKLFMDVHPWVNWENMMTTCLVGVMVPENHGTAEGESSLEDMD
ncbi:hypothetical protein LTR36_001360 [Oleoguttula mirabilis]|uniref:Cytochrome b5 heme-binding domain-containing protein n=1 Tax=Oleoguttula mirabilis TaxID=1507867 RepID=A0AAV9JRI3_9PEZI|nr:hypothetical protein LTR36_001360 [Oleoguttula mirabilis]